MKFFLDSSEARRRPKIVSPTTKSEPQASNKKSDFEYGEYEYGLSGHPVVEDSVENEHQELHESYVIKSIPSSKKPGYSSGSGLRSIAQGSADQVRQHSFISFTRFSTFNFLFA